jgi:hypothetical protein
VKNTIEGLFSDMTTSVQAGEAEAGVHATLMAELRRYGGVNIDGHAIKIDLPVEIHSPKQKALLAFLENRLNGLKHADNQHVNWQLVLVDQRRREDEHITQQRAREDSELSHARARQDEWVSQRREEEDALLESKDEQMIREEVVSIAPRQQHGLTDYSGLTDAATTR